MYGEINLEGKRVGFSGRYVQALVTEAEYVDLRRVVGCETLVDPVSGD
jgi:hypothetical protein